MAFLDNTTLSLATAPPETVPTFRTVPTADRARAATTLNVDVASATALFNETFGIEQKVAGEAKPIQNAKSLSTPSSNWKNKYAECKKLTGSNEKITSAIEGGIRGWNKLHRYEQALMKIIFKVELTQDDTQAIREKNDLKEMCLLLVKTSKEDAEPLLDFLDYFPEISPQDKAEICRYLINNANAFDAMTQLTRAATDADVKAGLITKQNKTAGATISYTDSEKETLHKYAAQFRRSALEIAFTMKEEDPNRNRLGAMAFLRMKPEERDAFIHNNQDRNDFLRFDVPMGIQEIASNLQDATKSAQALADIGSTGKAPDILANNIVSGLFEYAPDVGYSLLVRKINDVALRTETLKVVCGKNIAPDDFQHNLPPTLREGSSSPDLEISKTKADLCKHLIEEGTRTLSSNPRPTPEEEQNFLKMTSENRKYCLDLAMAIIKPKDKSTHITENHLVLLLISLYSDAENPETKKFVLDIYRATKPNYKSLVLTSEQLKTMQEIDKATGLATKAADAIGNALEVAGETTKAVLWTVLCKTFEAMWWGPRTYGTALWNNPVGTIQRTFTTGLALTAIATTGIFAKNNFSTTGTANDFLYGGQVVMNYGRNVYTAAANRLTSLPHMSSNSTSNNNFIVGDGSGWEDLGQFYGLQNNNTDPSIIGQGDGFSRLDRYGSAEEEEHRP